MKNNKNGNSSTSGIGFTGLLTIALFMQKVNFNHEQKQHRKRDLRRGD
ncbi:MAG: hypothetical protein MJ068_04710 [Clostridia bacterium]|nr:hypothetical protein [Clostridia bacterium]